MPVSGIGDSLKDWMSSTGMEVGGTSTTFSLQGSLNKGLAGLGFVWPVRPTPALVLLVAGHRLVEILSSLGPFPWETVRGLPPQEPLVCTW